MIGSRIGSPLAGRSRSSAGRRLSFQSRLNSVSRTSTILRCDSVRRPTRVSMLIGFTGRGFLADGTSSRGVGAPAPRPDERPAGQLYVVRRRVPGARMT